MHKGQCSCIFGHILLLHFSFGCCECSFFFWGIYLIPLLQRYPRFHGTWTASRSERSIAHNLDQQRSVCLLGNNWKQARCYLLTAIFVYVLDYQAKGWLWYQNYVGCFNVKEESINLEAKYIKMQYITIEFFHYNSLDFTMHSTVLNWCSQALPPRSCGSVLLWPCGKYILFFYKWLHVFIVEMLNIKAK